MIRVPGFLEKDGKAYCTEDFYRLFSPRCAGCGGSVRQNYLSAADGTWHPECFVCAVSLLTSDHTHASLTHTHTRTRRHEAGDQQCGEIPTHLLYSQHWDHKADENRMPDDYVAVEMMRINQGEAWFPVSGSFTSSANILVQHLVTNCWLRGSTYLTSLSGIYCH